MAYMCHVLFGMLSMYKLMAHGFGEDSTGFKDQLGPLNSCVTRHIAEPLCVNVFIK